MLWFMLACGPSADDIVRNLESANPVVREDSAKIARNVTPSSEMTTALIAILDDSSSRARINAIETLVELNVTDAVPKLCDLLSDPALPIPIQRATIDALGRLRSTEAVPTLIEYLERDLETPALDVIWALGFIGDIQALETLSKLREHSDAYVVHNATVALRELRP